MKIRNLRDLFVHELADLYSAEHQLIVALPKLAKAAKDPELTQALEDHLEVTRIHVERLEEVAKEVTITIPAQVCKGVKGIIEEGTATLKQVDDADTRDAAIIMNAQRAEHYEIAGYGGAAQFARQLDLSDSAALLEMTLQEEREADELLTSLAQGGFFTQGLNEKALA